MVIRWLQGLFAQSDKGRRSRSIPSARKRLRLEPLEDRRMLTLLGLTPGYPLIDFNNTPAQSPASNTTPRLKPSM